MEKPITVGSVVLSRAGRDKGNFFIVYNIVDDTFVEIVDGDIRKLENPKRKKIKHLKNTGDVLEGLAGKIIRNMRIYDAELFSALRKYNS